MNLLKHFLILVGATTFLACNPQNEVVEQSMDVLAFTKENACSRAVKKLTAEEQIRVDSVMQLPWFKEAQQAWRLLWTKQTPIVNDMSKEDQMAFFYDKAWRDSLLSHTPSTEKEWKKNMDTSYRCIVETKDMTYNEVTALTLLRTEWKSKPKLQLKFSYEEARAKYLTDK